MFSPLNLFERRNFRDKVLEILRKVPGSLEPGRYQLSEALGEEWVKVRRKTLFGIWFKRAIDTGQIAGIRCGGKTASNHQLYIVVAAED